MKAEGPGAIQGQPLLRPRFFHGQNHEQIDRQGIDRQACQEQSLDAEEDLIALGLATGLAAGEPPPFELLRFLDQSGLPAVAPARLEAAAILTQLLDGLPEERRSKDAVAAALAASKDWPKAYKFPDSWFEADGASAELVRSVPGVKARDAVLAQTVATRRAEWADKLAWIAKAARDKAARDGAPAGGRRKTAAAPKAAETWIDLALVARALLEEETPITAIPLAMGIAKQTVAVHRAR